MSFFSSLFSTKKTITVSSSVYNLAGDVNKRPNFLHTSIFEAIMGNSDQSLGEQLTSQYLAGPGIQLRGFARWARDTGYDSLIGLTSTPLSLSGSIDSTVLAPLLPAVSGQTLVIQSSSIGPADYTFWVDQFMVDNYPDQLSTAYTSDLNEATGVVTITLVTSAIVSFTLSGFDKSKKYLYVSYNYEIPAIPPSLGPPPTLGVPQSWSALQFVIYAQGSGNAGFDALFSTTTDTGYFFPYIPMMLDGKFISDTYLPTIYPHVKKAMKKAVHAKYDDLVTKVKANASIGDIDYVYAVFGVSLNTKENACRKYIYEFFLKIMEGLSLSNPEYATWQADWAAADASMTTWATWQAAQSNPLDPLYGTTQPTRIAYPASPGYSVTVANTTLMNYFINISWAGCVETTGTGVLTNDLGAAAKSGELWFTTVSSADTTGTAWVNPTVGTYSYQQTRTHIRLHWQVDANSWRRLDIYNLVHANVVYGGKAVVTLSTVALAESSESGFIIPLHEDIYKNMPLTDSTQMATACCFLVFNSYTVKKAPWYTAGWFKVLLIVVVIAFTAVTGGFSAGAVGLLGTNGAVGALFGLSGVTAAIVGGVANALAAMVLVQLISVGSKAIFGPQLGMIIGAVVGLLALQVGTALASGMNTSELFNVMTQPTNLLKLTVAAGDGYAQFMQIGVQKINNATQKLLSDYNTASAAIETQTETLLGSGGVDLAINPLALIDVDLPSTHSNGFLAEAPASFFSRTLLTGSEIADLSMSFVNNFCDANISTALPNQT